MCSDAAEVAQRSNPDRRTTLAWVAAITVVLGALLVASSWSWIGARFGESHDGRNAAVWGEASRSIRTEGIVESRFGGRTPTRSYANHPPGIVASTWIAESIGGEHRLVTRAPAWLGSIAAIALLALLLIDAGLRPWAVAAGMGVALSSAMFLVYGTMLDTPVTAVPFTLAVLVLAQRRAAGRWAPWWALAFAGAAAALSGWEAVFFSGAAGMWLVARAIWRRGGWAAALGLAGGTAAGLTVTLAWIDWVYGGLSYLTGNADYRASSATLPTSLSHQLAHLQDLIPLTGVVGGLGLVLAFANPRHRPLAAVVTVPVVAYALAFKGGADIHDYWNYPILIALALGSAVLLEVLADVLAERSHLLSLAVPLALGALVVLANLATTSDAEASVRGALVTPHLLDVAVAHAPESGPAMAYSSFDRSRSPWILYESGRDGLALDGHGDLVKLARRSPQFPVLVILASPDERVDDALRSGAYEVDGRWAVVPAEAALAAHQLAD